MFIRARKTKKAIRDVQSLLCVYKTLCSSLKLGNEPNLSHRKTGGPAAPIPLQKPPNLPRMQSTNNPPDPV